MENKVLSGLHLNFCLEFFIARSHNTQLTHQAHQSCGHYVDGVRVYVRPVCPVSESTLKTN